MSTKTLLVAVPVDATYEDTEVMIRQAAEDGMVDLPGPEFEFAGEVTEGQIENDEDDSIFDLLPEGYKVFCMKFGDIGVAAT